MKENIYPANEGTQSRQTAYVCLQMIQRKEALQQARFEKMMQKTQFDIVEQQVRKQRAGKHEDQLSVYSSWLLWLSDGSLM
jgi:hypothetical protein